MIQKSYSREFSPSPQYSFTNTGFSVTTTVPLSFDLETQELTSQKYLPLSDIEIVNNSSVSLFFYPNQDKTKKIVIPAGTIKNLDKNDVPAIRTGLIYTKSGTATTLQIEVTVWKRGVTADEMASIQHKKMFNKGGIMGGWFKYG